jgi:hypothetical protein
MAFCNCELQDAFLCAQPRMEISCLAAARAWHSEQVEFPLLDYKK